MGLFYPALKVVLTHIATDEYLRFRIGLFDLTHTPRIL